MNRLTGPLWAYVKTCLDEGKEAEAITTVAPLLELQPDDAMLKRAYVAALMAAHRYREAVPHLEWLYARDDGKDPETSHRYAMSLHLAGEFKRCLNICDETLARYPQFSQLYALRGGTWQVYGEWERMMEDCRRAVQLDPNNVDAATALALRTLMVSGLTEGFEGYSERVFESHEEPMPFFDLPSWDGEELQDKTLLLIWEQGVGDMIMFASFIPYLRAQGARLIIAVPQKLHALFARAFTGCEVVVVKNEQQAEALQSRVDFAVLMGNLIELCLPYYRPVQHPPYLKADATRAAELRKKYQTADRPYLVGIAWHTTNPETGLLRNIDLTQWQKLLQLPGIRFVSLQYDAKPGDLPASVLFDAAIDGFRDLGALAAQMAAMDEVVTIQNATAHLAGALGIPTTLLLSSASDWRWGIGEQSNPWYASVNILRQKEPLVWEPVMEEMAARLKERSSKK